MADQLSDLAFIRSWARGAVTRPASIAITGVAGCFPGCMDVATFWDRLDSDTPLITEIPRERFDWRDYHATSAGDRRMATRWGGFIPDIASFPAQLFGLLPAEADELDPRQRLLLMSTWRTLEDAGIDPRSRARSRTGVFIACEHNEYAQLMRDRGIVPKAIFNQADSMISNRISYFFDFSGPSEIVNTMCSGFAVALNRGVAALRSGEIDRAIVGAANIMLSPELFCALSAAEQLTSEPTVRSFGDGADGYVRGEAVGTILLEREADVRAAQRYSYATIRNTAVNYNGRGSVSIAAPDPHVHAELIAACYRGAGIDPSQLSYIEAQGMGLATADIAEWAALNLALRSLHRERGQHAVAGSCRVSTLKPMTGHMHAASSLGALLKIIRSFQTQKIHKVLGFARPNAFCDMQGTPCRVVEATEPWPAHGYPRLAALHSFGSGGNNAHVLLEEVPAAGRPAKRAIPPFELALRRHWFAAPAIDAPAIAPTISGDVRDRALQVIQEVLGLTDREFDATAPFSTLGVNSLSVLTFVARLEQELGIALRSSEVYSHPSPAKLADHAAARLGEARPSDLAASATSTASTVIDGDIAIIGISLKVAGARDHAEFWSNLRDGTCFVSDIPAERRAADGEAPRWRRGGFVADFDKFDPLFFNISPREAEGMDPRHRLLLEAAYSAIEDSGYKPSSWAGSRNSIILGLEESDRAQGDVPSITATHVGTAPARIGYFLDTKGPLLSLNTACSSSLVAVHYACQSLLTGESSCALAGGCNIVTDPGRTLGLLARTGNMLSPDGVCYAFDDRANGMVLGEGVGVVVLKRLADAVRDGDAIHGVIKGIGINYDGRTNGITAPSGLRQRELYEQVARTSGVDLGQIAHVVAHGTGTALGDPIECNALIDAHADAPGGPPCALTSVKPSIGHALGASGVINLIAAVMSVKQGEIPPTVNHASLNRGIDLRRSRLYVNTALTAWPSSPRYAAVSAFGHTGTNAHVIVAAHDAGAPVGRLTSAAAIVLSARSDERLRAVAEQLRNFVAREAATLDLAELAYTLQVGRDELPVRLGFVASSLDDVQHELERFLAGDVEPRGVGGRGAGDQLVAAWVTGARVAWDALYVERPRRCHLPSYPFAHDRDWTTRARPAAAPRATLDGETLDGDVTLDGITYVTQVMSELLGIPPDRIDPTTPLEDYGLDSLIVGELTNTLHEVFPTVNSTLFSQGFGIVQVVDFLRDLDEAALRALITRPAGPTPAGVAASASDASDAYDERAIRCLRPCATVAVRLLVFHGFGFGNRSLAWMSSLQDGIEVWGVGRTDAPDWAALVDSLADGVRGLFDRPVVVWGHSMGGVVAFEVLCRLEQRHGLAARQFVVSSAAPPALFARLKFTPPFYELDERMTPGEAIEILVASHYMPPAGSGVLTLSPRDVMNDVALFKRYAHDATQTLRAPLYIVQANNDVLIRDAAAVLPWQSLTRGGCRYQEIEGTHLFFIRPPRGFKELLTRCCLEPAPLDEPAVAPGLYALAQVSSGTADVHLFPLSAAPMGYLIYTACGHMAAHLWHPTRGQAVATEAVEDYLTYIAYTGTYHQAGGVVRHDVVASSRPDLERKQLDRFVEHDGERLTLVAAPVVMAAHGQHAATDHQRVVWTASAPRQPVAERVAGAWQLTACSLAAADAYKGQCLITQDGHVSVILSQVERRQPRMHGFALASNDELEASLASYAAWFGRLHERDGALVLAEVLVRHVPIPMTLEDLACRGSDGQLIIEWGGGDARVRTTWQPAVHSQP